MSERPRIDTRETACFILPGVKEALYFYCKKNGYLPSKITPINTRVPSAHSYPKPYVKRYHVYE